MVQERERIEPDPDARETYDKLYSSYLQTYEVLWPIMHELASHAERRLSARCGYTSEVSG